MVNQTEELMNQSKWKSVRYTRAILLREADDMINMVDDKGEDSGLIRQYRQALRDIPQTYDNPDDVVWPNKPIL